MIQHPEDRRPPITPQLALRVAILGGLALVLFAIIFFRLWYLEVLSGDQYLAQANNNRVRDIVVPAPRGDIVDRQGVTLVDNRVSQAIQVEPQKLPPAGRARRHLYHRLAWVLGTSARHIRREVVTQRRALPYANVTLDSDVSPVVSHYLFERQQEFPGVTVQQVYLRHYPHKDLAAQLFGTVGEIDPHQLKERRFRGVHQGTVVGQSGVEYVYDRYVRGLDGATRVQVDALGRPKGQLALRQPVQGKQLKLSIDLDLQRAGQEATAVAIGLANRNGNPAQAGGFVAMDPRNGEVLALGSVPSFDPNQFSKPLTPKAFRAIRDTPGAPLYNRAVAGLYPTGSTFKAVTATAALQSGAITPATPINDPGRIKISNIVFHNAGDVGHGTISLRRAIQVSSDVFFYTLGAQLNSSHSGPLQAWARRLGLGRPTGIDLPGEYKGLVPSPEWRNRGFARWLRYHCGSHFTDRCYGLANRPWTIGDSVNLAVGQGDLQATPLQMAVAYAAIANGGKVVRPHIGLEVEDVAGRVLQKVQPSPARRVHIAPGNRQAIMDGLRLAAGAPGGTSADVFKGFPYPVFGKTGTAQRPGQADQSWYVAYVPNPTRPIVIAVTIEKGGFGAEAAAPAARLMLSQWFHVKKRLVRGTSRTR